jgi:phosphoadenosine phosphosulfate reductase
LPPAVRRGGLRGPGAGAVIPNSPLLVRLRPVNEVWGYIARHSLPINPVYEKLRRIGAPEGCLRVTAMIDANGLELGRVTWLRRGWPDLFDELAQVLPRLREFV